MEGEIYVRIVEPIGFISTPLQGQKKGDLFKGLACSEHGKVFYLPEYSVYMSKVRLADASEVKLFDKGFKNINPFKEGDEVIVREDSILFSSQRKKGKQTVVRVEKGHMPIHTKTKDNLSSYCYHIKDLEFFKDSSARYDESTKEFTTFKVGDKVIVRKDCEYYSAQRSFGVQIIKSFSGSNTISTDKGRIYKSSDLEMYTDSTKDAPFKVGDKVIVKEGVKNGIGYQREEYGEMTITKLDASRASFQVTTNRNLYSYEHLELYGDALIQEAIDTSAIKKHLNHKFRIGDRVTIVSAGSGTGPKDEGKIVTITELGQYGSWGTANGYKISPALGNTLSGDYDGFIGEESFERYIGVKETMGTVDLKEREKDAILEKARVRYPIGTKVKCLVLEEPATTIGECRIGAGGCVYAKVKGNETKLYDFNSQKWANIISYDQYVGRDAILHPPQEIDFRYVDPSHYYKRPSLGNPWKEVRKEKPRGTGLFNVPKI